MILIVPAVLSSFRSLKDKTLKIEFETNELAPRQHAAIGQLQQSFGFLAFKKDAFRTEQLQLLEETKADYEDTTKTPSKRLRDVLFIAWKQNPEGFTEFEEYYRHKMEKFITHIKSRLE